MPSSASSSRRAAVPAALSTAPPLPMTMPFCESRSTRMTTRSARTGPDAVSPLLDLFGRHRDRMRQLVARDRQQLLAHELGGEERLGLIAHDAVGVIVRARSGSRASSSPTSASTPSPVRADKRHVCREVAELAGRRGELVDAIVLVAAASILLTTSTAGVLTSAMRAATNRSPGPIVGVRLDQEADRVDLGQRRERPLVRAFAEQRARLVHAGRVEEDDLRRRRVVRTPRTCVRVVCGRSETIETLAPTIALRSVDFPTFGRPTIATNPDRNSAASALRQLLPLPLRAATGRITTETMRRPCTRSAQNSMRSTATHSPSTGTCPSVLNTSPPTVSHSSWGSSTSRSSFTSSIGVRPGTRNAPSRESLDARLVGVVLVGDLADDLLEQVFHRDEPGGAAVFVDDDRHVELLGLHLAQELGDAFRLGHEVRGAQALAHRRGALADGAARDEILQEHEPDDVVGVLVVRGQPRLAGFDRGRDRFVDGRVAFDRDHVGAGQHHLAHDGVAELEDRVDELALFGLDRSLLGRDVGHREDLLLGHERAVAQTLAGQDDVGDPDEAAGQHAQRPEDRDEHEQRRDRRARRVRCAAARTSWARPRRA